MCTFNKRQEEAEGTIGGIVGRFLQGFGVRGLGFRAWDGPVLAGQENHGRVSEAPTIT